MTNLRSKVVVMALVIITSAMFALASGCYEPMGLRCTKQPDQKVTNGKDTILVTIGVCQ